MRLAVTHLNDTAIQDLLNLKQACRGKLAILAATDEALIDKGSDR